MGGEPTSEAPNWLFRPNFPEHWQRQPLYSFARWINGLAFRDIQFTQTGKPVIKIAEIKGGITGQTKFTDQTFDESVSVKRGDMLFSWSGQPETSIDAFWWRGEDGWLNQHIFKVIPSQELDPTFFFYVLRYLKPNFIAIARNKQTTGLGHVTKRDLESIEAAFPSLPEQKGIAAVLGALDNKIELNRRINETLEALARSLFKSWFTDTTQSAVPRGWREGKLRDCCERVENGGTPKRDEPRYWTPATIPWLTSGEVRQAIVTKTESFISDEGLANSNAKPWPATTTVVALYGATAGQVCLLGDTMCSNQACCGLIPKKDMRYYIYLQVSSSVTALEQQSRGSAQQNLSQQIVADFPTTIPNDAILEKFDKTVHPLFARWIANLNESRTLAALRDALLPKLLSGEIRVCRVEQ